MKKPLLLNGLVALLGLFALVTLQGQASAGLIVDRGAHGGPYVPAVVPDPADWPMYGHDPQRTNYNPAETTINAGNVGQLVERWRAYLGNTSPTSSAPNVSNGKVYAASSVTSGNNFFAFDAVNGGAPLWSADLGHTYNCFSVGIGSTAVISGSVLSVGGGDQAYYGLNADTGAQLWREPMTTTTGTSYFPWASPLLAYGRSYLGMASCADNPSVRGEIRSVDMNIGGQLANQYFVPAGQGGAGIWNSPAMSPDGSLLVVTTGEDYGGYNGPYNRAIVSLDPITLAILQSNQQGTTGGDRDYATTPLFFSDSQSRTLVGAIHKNNNFYAFVAGNINGGPIWSRSVTYSAGMMPAYDPTFGTGGTLFYSNGSTLYAVNPENGTDRWPAVTSSGLHGNLAVANGLLFLNRGGLLEIRDETNGAVIRTITPTTTGSTYTGPIVSHGFVYWLSGGWLNAWSLPAGTTPTDTPTPTNTPTATSTVPTATATNTVPTATGTPTNRPCTLTPTGTRPATPGPCQLVNVTLLREDFNSGTLGQFNSSVVLTNTGGWTPVVVGISCFTNYAAFAPDPDSVSDQRLTLTNAISIPANYTSVILSFLHYYAFQQVGNQHMDGGVFELSTDDGATWFDGGPYLTASPYNGTITRTGETCGGITPPFTNGQGAWVSNGTDYTIANLQSFVGMSIKFRFRLGSDCTGGDTGWHIDDITLTGTYINACTPSPTRTGITATRTATYTPTSTPTVTPGGPTFTWTATNTPTVTPGGPTDTSTPTVTMTVCPVQFTDVPPGSTFYDFVKCLACRGIVNGYSDGTFRPNNNVTRGQLSKIVSNAAGFTEPAGAQMFEDVPPGSTFYDFIQRLASRGYISGYACGAPEPCVPPGNRAYFRPGNNATRGQISKIVSNAAGFSDPAGTEIFEDVVPGSTFYDFVQRLASRGLVNGYQCGGAGEPCIAPENRPYFRPNNNATRGQTSKIVANAFFPGCQTPGR